MVLKDVMAVTNHAFSIDRKTLPNEYNNRLE
jgi:hypothetical protein